MKRILPFGHDLLSSHLSNEDIAIDATVGNGNDTVLIARLCNHVYGFDIQEVAIQNTQSKLDEEGLHNVTLIQDGHENLDQYVSEKVKAIVYNLGYLPGGNPSIISTSKTTITSIKKGLQLLVKSGIILLTLYIGHEGGKDEANAIEEFVSDLNSKDFSVLKYQFMNTKNSPYVIVIQKK